LFVSVLFRKLIFKPSERVGKILRSRRCCQSFNDLNSTDRAVTCSECIRGDNLVSPALLLGANNAQVFRAGGKRCQPKKLPYPFALSGGKYVSETRILIPEAAWHHLNLYGTAVDIGIGG
jgi:hypothetical protein